MTPQPSRFADLAREPRVVMPAAILLFIALVCLFGPLVIPHAYDEDNLALGASPPSAEHWLGTDQLGRDMLARILYGGRVSLLIAVLATAVSLLIGVAYGMISGLSGGGIDRAMMRTVDSISALPFPLFVLLLMTVLETRDLWVILLAIGAVEWLTIARIVRAQTLELRERAFVDAARSLGQAPGAIMGKHFAPNLLSIVIVYATLTVPSAMLLEAFISFLGLGVQAPETSLGDLIKNGAELMEQHYWLLLFPSLVFALTLFALHFLGDALRDCLDPRQG